VIVEREVEVETKEEDPRVRARGEERGKIEFRDVPNART